MISEHCPPGDPHIIEFQSLDLVLCRIKIIDRIHPPYYFLSQLYLDSNNLFTLNGIEQFLNLEIFSFCWNSVGLFSELHRIKNAFFMKRICFIGNPLEYDERARFEYLVVHLFKNLEGIQLEQRDAHKINKRINKQNKKIEDRDLSEEEERMTERYKPKMRNESIHTRKISVKTSVEGKNDHYFERTPKLVFNNIRGKDHASMTNRIYEHKIAPRRSYADRDQERIRNENHNLSHGNIFTRNSVRNQNSRVHIRPFEEAEEEQYEGIYDESEIKEEDILLQKKMKAHSVSLFSQTGHFDEETKYEEERRGNQNEHDYKSYVKEILKKERYLIAKAFHEKSLVIKAFETLNLRDDYERSEEDESKRKAMIAIKLASAFSGRFDRSRQKNEVENR